jgi:hypothetical protein
MLMALHMLTFRQQKNGKEEEKKKKRKETREPLARRQLAEQDHQWAFHDQ